MSVPAPNGPAYPLSREEFCRALTTGHGRAKVHVERFGAADFRDEIIEAAAMCKVYDAQSEGTRGDWLAELCLAAGAEREVIALPVPSEYWDREQRASLMKEFAVRGVAGAREALYACFGRAEHSCDVHAAEEILALDGEAGLLFVARQLGADVADGGANWISGYQLSMFDEERGEGAARALLEGQALSDPHVRAYLDAIDRDLENDAHVAARPRKARETTEQVLDAIRTNTQEHGGLWVRRWAMSAGREELQQVLELLPMLTHPRALELGLRCLGGAGMPPLDPLLFELTRHADAGVRYWAARVLSKHSLPGVRSCGLEALARGDVVVAHEILTRSAQVDDVEELVAALRPLDDPNEEHAVGYGILDLFEHSPEVRDARLALHVYERTPCMNCRGKAVCFLVHRNQAPAWLLEECAYDADEEIRAHALAARTPRPSAPGVS